MVLDNIIEDMDLVCRILVPLGIYLHMIVLTMSLPSVSLYFLTYEKTRNLFNPEWGSFREFFAGVFAQTASSIIATPRDVVAQRLQVQHLQKDKMKNRYSGPLHAFQDIIKTEGVRKGLYRGYFQELSLWSIYGGLYLAAFLQTKRLARTLTGNTQEFMPPYIVAPCACSAAAFSALLTNPIDVMKLHYQVKPGTPFLTLMTELQQTYGPRVWLKGSIARVLGVSPRTTVAFVVYEFCKKKIKQYAS